MRPGTLGLLLGLAACGGVEPVELALPAASAGGSTLTVERTNALMGFGMEFTLLVDGEPVANLMHLGRATVPVQPGMRQLELLCGGGAFGSSDDAILNVEPGRAYRMAAYGSMNSTCNLRPMR